MTEAQKRAKRAAERANETDCGLRCHHGTRNEDRCEECVNEGRYTYAKPAERTMHTARDLRELFRVTPYAIGDVMLGDLTRQVRYWLMDMQHEKRMARDLEAQKVIQELIDRIK